VTTHMASCVNHSALVTIIVVNFNSGAMIKRCLAALRAQTCTQFATIVVDNGSTDGSTEQIAIEFPEVRLFPLGSNTGFAAANNFALRKAPLGDWVVFLNPDAFAHPNWLASLVAASAEYPDFDGFGSRLCGDSEGLILDGIGDSYHVSGLVWRTGHGCRATGSHLRPREIFSPCAAAAMFRRQTLERVGGFDEDFFCYVEDIDLGFRLRLLGCRSLYVPDAMVHHLGSGVVGVHSDFQIYHGHRNLVWAFVKNMPGILLWLFLPFHILLNIVTLIWFVLRGRSALIMRAKYDALSQIPHFWNKRKAVQSVRKASIWSILQLLSWNPFTRCH
jgi:GT2 family glycosyltransferase